MSKIAPWEKPGGLDYKEEEGASVLGVPGKVKPLSWEDRDYGVPQAGKKPQQIGLAPWEKPGGLGERESSGYLRPEDPYEGGSSTRIGDPKGEEIDEGGPGWLETALGALDYAGNISRSGMLHGWDGMKKAFEQEIYTSPTDVKDAIFGKHRAGKDDKKFQWGDIADYAADIGVDILTDPLTYVPVAGWLAKGGKAAGAASKAAGVAKKANVDLPPQVIKMAKDYQTFKNIAVPGMGAVYGAGIAGEDASMLERAVYATAGAAGVKALGKAAPGIGKIGRKYADRATDAYYTMSRGPDFKGYAGRREKAIAAQDKIENISGRMRRGRFGAMENLSDDEVLHVVQFEKDYMKEFNALRNPKVAALEYEMGFVKPGKKYSKKQADAINNEKRNTELYKSSFNNITDNVTKQLDETGGFVDNFKAKQTNKIVGTLDELAAHNESIIKEFNQELYGISKPNAKGEGIVGIKYHTPTGQEREVYDKTIKDVNEYFNKAKKFKVWRSKLGGKDAVVSREVEDAIYHQYSDQWAKKFLDETEIGALRYMRQVEEAPLKNKGFKAHEWVLDKVDKLQGFVKQQMLMATQSWTVNNYFDNLMKSYVENGVGAVAPAATLGTFNKKLFKDVWDSYRGNMKRKFSEQEIETGVRLGVIDNPTMKAMMDDSTAKYLYSPEKLAELEKKGWAKKAVKGYTDFLQATTGTFGSTIEGVARMVTFSKHRKFFTDKLGKELSQDQIDKLAAKVSHETFFNYRELSALNEKVTKRIFPFASFYLKNAPYWGKALFDPTKAARIGRVEKLRKNIGDDPSEFDRTGQTDYIRSNAPRKLGFTSQGEKEYLFTPSNSMHDFIQMAGVTSLGAQAVEKLTPLLKAPYEGFSGQDLFTGGDYYTDETGKKYLFSRGHKWVYGKRLLESMGMDLGGRARDAGVQLDENGNPYATSDNFLKVDKLISTLLPIGAFDTVAGSIGKILNGKETWGEAARNVFLPMRTVKVSKGLETMMRKKSREMDTSPFNKSMTAWESQYD